MYTSCARIITLMKETNFKKRERGLTSRTKIG
jgi:hypothetical protein